MKSIKGKIVKIGNAALLFVSAAIFGTSESVRVVHQIPAPMNNGADFMIRGGRRDDIPDAKDGVVPSLDHVAGIQISGATGSSVAAGIRPFAIPGETQVLQPQVNRVRSFRAVSSDPEGPVGL